jgi:hypothetical protein
VSQIMQAARKSEFLNSRYELAIAIPERRKKSTDLIRTF